MIFWDVISRLFVEHPACPQLAQGALNLHVVINGFHEEPPVMNTHPDEIAY